MEEEWDFTNEALGMVWWREFCLVLFCFDDKKMLVKDKKFSREQIPRLWCIYAISPSSSCPFQLPKVNQKEPWSLMLFYVETKAVNAFGFACLSKNYDMKCTHTIAQSVESLYPGPQPTMSLEDLRSTSLSCPCIPVQRFAWFLFLWVCSWMFFLDDLTNTTKVPEPIKSFCTIFYCYIFYVIYILYLNL